MYGIIVILVRFEVDEVVKLKVGAEVPATYSLIRQQGSFWLQSGSTRGTKYICI